MPSGGEIDADRLVLVIAARHFARSGAGLDLHERLKITAMTQRETEKRLGVENGFTISVDERSKGLVSQQRIEHNLVAIEPRLDVKTKDQLDVLNVDRTDGEVIRRDVENHPMQLIGIGE